jgi:hypothetical protein
MNFKIMGANKPKKLELLTHQHIKKFKSDFTHYFHETNGQAMLLGLISDEVVTIIDSLLGAQEEHRHLLCHGDDVEFTYLTEEQRAARPWLFTRNPQQWTSLLDTLLILKPAGGAFQTQTYEHLMARAEESIANFALDHLISGEDKYLERLLENDRVCELSQYDAQQVKSNFQFLIVGSKVPSAQYKGFNVHPKSKDPQDTQRIAVMKERAMLQLRNFKKTRHLVDWIVVYLSDLRKAVSSLEAFQGRTAVPATKQNDQNKSRGWQEKSAAGHNEAS